MNFKKKIFPLWFFLFALPILGSDLVNTLGAIKAPTSPVMPCSSYSFRGDHVGKLQQLIKDNFFPHLSQAQLNQLTLCLAKFIFQAQSIPFMSSNGSSMEVVDRCYIDQETPVEVLLDFKNQVFIDFKESTDKGTYKTGRRIIGIAEEPRLYFYSVFSDKETDSLSLSDFYKLLNELSILQKIENYRPTYTATSTKKFPFPQVTHNPLDNPHFFKILQSRKKVPPFGVISENYQMGNLKNFLNTYDLYLDGKKIFINQLMEAIQILQRLEIVSRDFKDSNVVIDERWDIGVIDFGLGAIIGNKKTPKKLTLSVGTNYITPPEYMQREMNLSKELPPDLSTITDDDFHRYEMKKIKTSTSDHPFNDVYAFDRYSFAITSLQIIWNGELPYSSCYTLNDPKKPFERIEKYYDQLLTLALILNDEVKLKLFHEEHQWLMDCFRRVHQEYSSRKNLTPLEKVLLKEIHPDYSLRHANGEIFFKQVQTFL